MRLGLQGGVGHLGDLVAHALQQRAGHQAAGDHEDPGVVEGVHGALPGRDAEDGHQPGHAERDADLAAHDVERRPGGEALRGQGRRGGAAERGQHEPDADAAEQAARQVGAGPVGGDADVGDPPHAAGREEQRADGAHGPVAEAGAEEPAGEGGDAGQQRPGGDHEPGGQHRLVPQAGEEQDAAEHERAEAAEEGERAEVGQGHGAVADDGRLDDRVGVPQRAQHQPGARRDGQPEGTEDPPAGPAPVRALDDAGDQAGHGDRQQCGAEEVGLLRIGVPHLVEGADAEDERDQRRRAG